MPTLKIFSHKGVIGAVSDMEHGTFLNDLESSGQMGVVVGSEEVEITTDALALMKNYSRLSGSFSGTMLTEHDDGGSSIGLIGFGSYIIADNEPVEYGRTCSLSVLDKFTINDDMEIPDGFLKYADGSDE